MVRHLATGMLCILLSTGNAAAAITQKAPSISGTPPTEVKIDELFDFTPVSFDANGDALMFTIANQPKWAEFNKYNGRLVGTARAGEEGVYSGIQIFVSDGRTTVALPAFSVNVVPVANGQVTLSWYPPTSNEDGSALTSLAGYWIYMGRDPYTLNRGYYLNLPGLTRVVVDNLPAATWYFAMTAVTYSGIESRRSATVSKVIP